MDGENKTHLINVYAAKNELPTLRIDDIQIHSAYDPIKEAVSFAEGHVKTLQGKNKILVLGLGLGYHIEEVFKKLNVFHNDGIEVFIIEPVKDLISYCKKLHVSLNDPRVKLFLGEKIKDLYSNDDLIKFLMKRPGVIAHPATFNLHKEYYSEYLKYQAPTALQEIYPKIENKDLADYYLQKSKFTDTFEEFIEMLRSQQTQLNDPYDFFNLALDKIGRPAQERG